MSEFTAVESPTVAERLHEAFGQDVHVDENGNLLVAFPGMLVHVTEGAVGRVKIVEVSCLVGRDIDWEALPDLAGLLLDFQRGLGFGCFARRDDVLLFRHNLHVEGLDTASLRHVVLAVAATERKIGRSLIAIGALKESALG